jgi:hypothetical protein
MQNKSINFRESILDAIQISANSERATDKIITIIQQLVAEAVNEVKTENYEQGYNQAKAEIREALKKRGIIL